MKQRIKSIKGLFGQTIHYKDGVKVGESWPGLFEGSYEHYNAYGQHAGYSDPGLFADLVHYDEHGARIGETYTGFFGQKKHYSTDGGFVGDTWDGFTGETTDLFDGDSFSDPFADE